MIATETAWKQEFGQLEQAAEWERAAQMLDLPRAILRRLRTPQFEMAARYPLGLGENAELVTVYGCVSGPASAASTLSIRVDPSASAQSVARSAEQLQLRAALAGLGESAAAIGVQLHPEETSEPDLWMLARDAAPRIARQFTGVRLFAEDVPSAAFAAWMAHRSAPHSLTFPRISTAEYCAARERLLGRATATLCSCALQRERKSVRGAKAIVVGTGSVSRRVIETLVDDGVSIVALADESGGLQLNPGTDVELLLSHTERGGLLAEYADGQHVRHTEVLSASADALILLSPNSEITSTNVAALKASVVVDCTGSGIAPDSSAALADRASTVIPDALVNSALLLPQLAWQPQSFADDAAHVQLYLQRVWDELDLIARRFETHLHRAVLLLALQRLAAWAVLERP